MEWIKQSRNEDSVYQSIHKKSILSVHSPQKNFDTLGKSPVELEKILKRNAYNSMGDIKYSRCRQLNSK